MNAPTTVINNDKNKKLILIIATVLIILLVVVIGLIFLFSQKNSNTTNPSQQQDNSNTTPTTVDEYPSPLPANFCPEKLTFSPSLMAESNGKKYILTQSDLVWVESNCPNVEKKNQTRTSSNNAPWTFSSSENKWSANGEVPACENPLTLETPVNLNLVTTILYPGQTRGGDYKPHGGFRFDSITNNTVDVKVPADALVVSGTKFLYEGEIQYSFDFIMPCGIKFRLGHLRELSPTFQQIANNFPEPKEMDSRITLVSPNVSVKKGDLIATKIGITATGNTFVDFGVYDLRQKNQASMNVSWADSHPVEHAHYGVCWFDILNASDEAKVRSLPAADPTSGKYSDYCK